MNMEIHYSEGSDWAALYVDGVLIDNTVGDSYLAETEAFRRAGVKQVQDDAWMRGGNGREGVANTLAEVDDYALARDELRAEVTELRAEAARLEAEATALEGQHR